MSADDDQENLTPNNPYDRHLPADIPPQADDDAPAVEPGQPTGRTGRAPPVSAASTSSVAPIEISAEAARKAQKPSSSGGFDVRAYLAQTDDDDKESPKQQKPFDVRDYLSKPDTDDDSAPAKPRTLRQDWEDFKSGFNQEMPPSEFAKGAAEFAARGVASGVSALHNFAGDMYDKLTTGTAGDRWNPKNPDHWALEKAIPDGAAAPFEKAAGAVGDVVGKTAWKLAPTVMSDQTRAAIAPYVPEAVGSAATLVPALRYGVPLARAAPGMVRAAVPYLKATAPVTVPAAGALGGALLGGDVMSTIEGAGSAYGVAKAFAKVRDNMRALRDAKAAQRAAQEPPPVSPTEPTAGPDSGAPPAAPSGAAPAQAAPVPPAQAPMPAPPAQAPMPTPPRALITRDPATGRFRSTRQPQQPAGPRRDARGRFMPRDPDQ